MSQTTYEIRDAETYEPIDPAAGAILLTQPKAAAAEQYRLLAHRLELLGQRGTRALCVTSALGGEGRTTTTVNAALALGRGGRQSVALVDGDLRRPGVHRLLGLRPREGLCDVVAGRAQLGDCLWKFGADQLYVLPAGNVPDDPSSVLYARRLGEVLRELKQRYDYVLVDAPPALRLADVPALCRDLDGVVVVVRAGATPRERVLAALDALVGVPVHGLVLNDVEPSTLVAPLPAPATRLLPAVAATTRATSPGLGPTLQPALATASPLVDP